MEVIFAIIGIALVLIGWAKILIRAFFESALWGLGCLLIQPVMLAFVFLNWDETKSSFFLLIIGAIICMFSISV